MEPIDLAGGASNLAAVGGGSGLPFWAILTIIAVVLIICLVPSLIVVRRIRKHTSRKSSVKLDADQHLDEQHMRQSVNKAILAMWQNHFGETEDASLPSKLSVRAGSAVKSMSMGSLVEAGKQTSKASLGKMQIAASTKSTLQVGSKKARTDPGLEGPPAEAMRDISPVYKAQYESLARAELSLRAYEEEEDG